MATSSAQPARIDPIHVDPEHYKVSLNAVRQVNR
jgi:hypothetical protein